RLYDRLFNHEAPDKGERDFMAHVNADSLRVVEQAWIEPALAQALPEQGFQFEREGYFVADRHDHRAQAPVFNRTIGLRDSWGEQAGDAE
ncbi:MAG: glutamine--tRNA ligase, partial [Halioglobus sp.]